MLIAYLDEFGHVGPYFSTQHDKFFHNPVFGYAGLILPEAAVRPFGARFETRKARQFRSEIIAAGKQPRRWEKKGSEIFTTGAIARYPYRVQDIADLAGYGTALGGRMFFYGEVKPIGTQKMTNQTAAERTTLVLAEAIRRLCRYADHQGQNLTVLLDKGGPTPREDAISSLASFIYAGPERSLRRIIEVPMELESHRYGAMQFADWICALTTRTVHFHLSDSDEFRWAPPVFDRVLGGRATQESRIWIPRESRKLSVKSLAHARKWLTLGKANQPREREHLTQTVGEALSWQAHQPH